MQMWMLIVVCTVLNGIDVCTILDGIVVCTFLDGIVVCRFWKELLCVQFWMGLFCVKFWMGLLCIQIWIGLLCLVLGWDCYVNSCRWDFCAQFDNFVITLIECKLSCIVIIYWHLSYYICFHSSRITEKISSMLTV